MIKLSNNLIAKIRNKILFLDPEIIPQVLLHKQVCSKNGAAIKLKPKYKKYMMDVTR